MSQNKIRADTLSAGHGAELWTAVRSVLRRSAKVLRSSLSQEKQHCPPLLLSGESGLSSG